MGLFVLLSALSTASEVAASDPLPEGVWYMPGASIGFTSPSLWLFGGELSIVCADCVRGAFPFGTWVGGYADAVHDVDREQVRVSLGPEIGLAMIAGLDGGVLVAHDDGGMHAGLTGRFLLTIGLASLWIRYGNLFIGAEQDHLETGVLLKVPIEGS